MASLLQEHAHDLGQFFATDPKAQALPSSMATLARHLADERATALEELAALRKNVEHVNHIVSMQQGYARVGGVLELQSLAALVEDALQIHATILARAQARVVRRFDGFPTF